MKRTRVLALLPLFVGLAHSFSWDIVVGDRRRLEFYYNATLTHAEDILMDYITSVTYDPVHYRVLFAGHHINKLISSFDLSTRKIQTLITRGTNDIISLAYDPVTQLLFWSEERKIYSFSLKPASPKEAVDVNVLVTLNHSFGDIAVDSCGGFVYWMTAYEIERAAFDGSKREVLINGHVYWRRSLAIDQQTEKMYWIEETTLNQHSIKSADLNGKNRVTIYFIGTEYGATALTITKDFIYWRSYEQKAILQLPKNQQHSVGPIIYSHSSRNYWYCQVIAANYTINEQALGMKSCEFLQSQIRNNSSDNNSPDLKYCQHYCFQGNCSVSAEGQPKCSCEAGYSGERCEINACYMYCLHGGACSLNDENEPVCRCTADYEGERCDVSICKDYCVQGNCSVTTDGQPTCRCNAGYFGERCEVNACQEHCLNNGVCTLNEEDEPVCQCTADYDGERCELSALVSADGQPNSRCSADNSADGNVNACHQYCLNDGVCSLNEDSEPVCQCTGDYEGDRCDVPGFLIKTILYAFKNIPAVTLCKEVKSTCASTVV